MIVKREDKLSKARVFEMLSRRQLSSEEGFRLLKDLQHRHQQRQRFPGIGDTPGASPVKRDSTNGSSLSAELNKDLVKLAARVLNVKETDLSGDGDLHGYGFESVTLAAFADKINETFNLELMPTVFFELEPPTVNGLAGYLCQQYQDRMTQYYGERLKGFSQAGAISGKRETRSGRRPGEAIAIIGMSGILPQAENLETFWQHLEAGNDLVSEVPPHRWDWKPYGSDSGARWGAFIKDVDKFDAEFFNISPREARLLDPQQRIFLETVWNTIEDAGYKASDLSGTRTGLFVGVSTPDYQSILFSGVVPVDSHHIATSLSCALVANRVSYLLNFHGPSEPIDTACSSSLVAVHRGVEAIWNGTCDQAIVGGVNVIISPGLSLAFYSTGMLAKDGRCKTFDERADGYVRGEGVAAVFLKPLHQATADNDHIYAVIKSTAENHGGHAHSLTAPNANAQAALLIEAYERALIDPRTVTYIETHGTGTELGDPVEINGLKKAFDHLYQQRGIPAPDKPFCALGSVKTNIGHLETAAGIAGLIKVLLAMKYKKIPMNLHFRKLNPYFELDRTPFFVIDKTQAWEHLSDDKNQPIPRRAGISSFGFGGSNVHVVLEERPENMENRGQTTNYIEQHKGKTYLFVFSAKNTPRLNAYIEKMIHFLEKTFPSSTASSTGRDPAGHIQKELLSTASRILKVNISDIHPDEVLEDWGFDQVTLSILAAQLEEKYHRGINLETLYQYPSIHALALYLSGEKPTSLKSPEVRSTEVSLADMAYTLQVGRESMEERLAVVASTPAQLWEKLNQYYHDNSENTNIEGVYRGNSSTPKQDIQFTETKIALENDDLEKIAQLFVAGINIDWQLLYPVNKPKRLSLPTYPFERKRHWLEQTPGPQENTAFKESKIPLVMTNRQHQEGPVNQVNQIKSQNRKIVLKKTSTGPGNSTYDSPQPSPHVQPGVNKAAYSSSPRGRDALARQIKEILAAVLFKSPMEIDENKAFMELGLDSILAVELVKQLEQAFQVEIKATQLYDYSTVNQLARYVSTIIPGQSLPVSAPGNQEEPRGKPPVPAASGPASSSTGNNNGSDRYSEEVMSLVSHVKEILANVLMIEISKIDENKPFMELGLDSILAVELAKQLEQVFQVEIKATQLYDYSTVNTLASHLHSLGVTSSKGLTMPAAGPSGPSMPPIPSVSSPPPEAAKPSSPRESAEVAVIGMSGRFPGADNIYRYWQNLANSVNSVTEVPADRWDVNQYYEPDTTDPNKTYCKWGGFLQDVDQFDPLFFNISPAEAELLDPQQRLFLQEAWRAIEDAGYAADSLSNSKCGVYVGVMSGQEYPSTNMLSAYSILPARISYFLNLKGPAVPIDTACSSSLIALHLACKSLLNGETDMMLAGGVTLFLTEKPYIGMSMMEMLSRDGKCKTFDNQADGFVPGEGVGAVVLKLLDKAVADGDHIYGVIKGSGINQDGKTNGITAPSAQSQKDLELEVYKNSGINPGTITYVEAHGTGTKLGDPIEIEALTEAFRQYTPKKQYCPIGSVKTNIGHPSAAAGIASVIKVLLALEHKKIPPSLHFHQENEHINFKDSPFYVNTSLIDWKAPPGVPRRAAVSSFGYSGTNAHMIIQEPPGLPVDTPPVTLPFYFIPISARNEEVLHHKYKDLLHWLDQENTNRYSPEDIAVTLTLGRAHFSLRSALLVKDIAGLKQMLTLVGEGKTPENYSRSKVTPSLPRQEEMKEESARLLRELQTVNRYQWSEGEYKNKLTALANLYIKGYNPDWRVVYQGREYRRISLPTYPFARERYWNPGLRWEGTQGNGQEQTQLRTPGIPVPPDETSPIRHIQQDLIKLMETLLKVKEKDIDVDESMFQYGFDSITFTEYIKQINKRYDIEFAMESFFDLGNPTIRSLSQYLYKQFKNRFTRYSRESGPVVEEAGGVEPMAIIGLSAVMPRSEDPETSWKHLAEGKRLITPIPKERWELEMSEKEMKAGTQEMSSSGGFLKGVKSFDAEFFGVSPQEAECIDPRQLILLETAWETIEDAGYKVSDLSSSKIGVFIGASDGGYHEILHPTGEKRKVCLHGGNALSMAANRISLLFNLRGPSEVIDTASSGSLVAVHRGVEALRSGTCSMAIVGGVHIIPTPTLFGGGQPDGCIPGEGAGAILLKPLGQATADGDHIYALIKGSAENHSGRSASLKTPNAAALAGCLNDAYTNARLNPNSLTYIEANSIGTGNGDPAEIQALKTIFSQWDKPNDGSLPPGARQPHCGIGSIKPNIGHLEAAAGIIAVIKVLLALKHQTLPVTIGLEKKSPPTAGEKEIEGSPLYMVRKTVPWERLVDKENQVIPRRAGINAFGRGGTNAHVILEEWPRARGTQRKAHGEKQGAQGPWREQDPHLIILSAKNEERLKAYAEKLKDFLEAPDTAGGQKPGPQEPADKRDPDRKIEDDILLISNETLKAAPGGYEPASIDAFIRRINEKYHLKITADLFIRQLSIGAFIKYLKKSHKEEFKNHYNSIGISRNSIQPDSPHPDLVDTAYTLQVGREEMDERLAVVVSCTRELKEKLDAYCQGKNDIRDLFRGTVNHDKTGFGHLMAGEEKEEFIKIFIRNRNFAKLAYCWVWGVSIDWKLLYQGKMPKRISLPTYPFKRQ
ncbi:MAG: hypothetical protein JSV88_28270 [Candidatus Aminicenantes bacterium]|nr:MAG: hypothetical protein JSV88_28270 [Candidatus Aminicenantes bacterium]